jgi:hypothetical protein
MVRMTKAKKMADEKREERNRKAREKRATEKVEESSPPPSPSLAGTSGSTTSSDDGRTRPSYGELVDAALSEEADPTLTGASTHLLYLHHKENDLRRAIANGNKDAISESAINVGVRAALAALSAGAI